MNIKSNIGSIGAIGKPVYDSHNNRVKGFCPYVVTSQDMINPTLEEARQLRDGNYSTRIILRFITNSLFGSRHRLGASYGTIKPSGLEISQQNEQYFNGFETEPIPLAGRWKGHYVQYFGENIQERTEPENVRLKEDKIVAESIRVASRRNPLLKPMMNGYRIQLGIVYESDLRQLHELYNIAYRDYVFPLTPGNIAEVVGNPKSITAVARNTNGDIVSIAIAEVVEIPTDDGLLRISEISDEATHPNHRGNGLNQACVHTVTEELMKTYGDEIHLIYAEDRATSRGVNQQSANLGWVYAGRLNRHCRIDADRDIEVEGPYEDLNVWHFPR